MILIQNALTLTPSGEGKPLDVLIDKGEIADVVPRGTVKGEGMERVDAAGRALMPALVNGHNHAQTGLAKGRFDRYNLETYLNAQPGVSGRRTLEDKHLSALIGAAELVRKGCTAGYDMFAEFPSPTVEGVDAVARAYAEAGMRAVIAPMMADKSLYEAIPGLADALPEPLRSEVLKARYAPYKESLAVVEEISKRWTSKAGKLALGPTIPHHCSDEFLVACRDLAKQLDIGIQMHVAESRMQSIVGRKTYGATLVSHLDSLGLLNEKFCAAHGVWLDDSDRKRLADAGASISHNPGSNLKLGSGIADMRAMLDHGLNVAIGTDGAASSDNLNVFEAMRLASYVSRAGGRAPERWISAREALCAATEGGAKALGFAKLGRIEKGWKADLVLLDLSALHYIPLSDLVNQIVFAEDGTGIESVMAAGRWVVRERKLLTVDVEALKRKAEEAVQRLNAANVAAKAVGEKLHPIVGHYCAGLA